MPNKLIAIVGPTASGKSALALELAERLHGEIICADARTIYRGMDIGTAKPTPEERARVPHHMLDVIAPDEPYSAKLFKEHALSVIEDISARGKLPILVGGTGLYVDAILYDFEFRPAPDPDLRHRLQKLSVDELRAEVVRLGIAMPRNEKNPVHLVRAIETGGAESRRGLIRDNTLVLGIMVEKEELEQRIRARVNAMMAAGLEQEVSKLAALYGWGAPGLRTIGYAEWREYFEGSIGQSAVAEHIIQNSLRYAKRQKTWFKRNNSIQWGANREELVAIATTYLNKKTT